MKKVLRLVTPSGEVDVQPTNKTRDNIVIGDVSNRTADVASLAACMANRQTFVPLAGQWTSATKRELTRRVVKARDAIGDAATIIATSGSTGEPKLAVHSAANHDYSASGAASLMPLNGSHTWLLSLPLFHVAGIAIVWRCQRAGARVAVPESLTLAQALDALQPSHVSLVPTQLQRLLKRRESVRTLRNCEVILLGGAPIPASLRARAATLDLRVYPTYGATEMSSQITTAPPDELLESHLGAPLPHRQVRCNADGEIEFRGETLFCGYIQDGFVERDVTTDGWFSSGDLGRLENGRLDHLGRRDNMFISGGENIHPEEIERAIASLPNVVNAAVVAVADDTYGARPVAFVEGTAELPALSAQLTDLLPRFKIPDAFFPFPALPRGAVKPTRKWLKSIAEKRINSSA